MRGFNLIEVIIVIAIIVVMAAAAVPIYGHLQGSSQLNDVSDQIIQALRTAQARSQARLNNTQHGVYFTDNAFVLYQGSSYGTQDESYTRTTTLDSAITVTTTLNVNGSQNKNYSLNQPTTASTTIIQTSQGNDGNYSTLYGVSAASVPTGEWWQIDLGSAYPINLASTTWWPTDALNTGCTPFTIKGSDNGINFTNVYTSTTLNAPNRNQQYVFDTQTYRWWRLVCDIPENSTSFFFTELDFHRANGTAFDINFSRGLSRPSATGTIVINNATTGARVIKINDQGAVEEY